MLGVGEDLRSLADLDEMAFDRLLVADTVDRLRDYAALLHAQLLSDEPAAEGLPPAGEQLVEVAVTLGSSLNGVRLGDTQLRQRFGVDILALHCTDGALPFDTPGIHQRRLKASDVLLVQGDAWEIARMKTGSELLVLDGMAERLSRLLSSKEQLLLDVSHELRSPLTRIKVALELLPDGQAKKSITGDVSEMEKMINEILETARMHHLHGNLERQPINLTDLLEEILAEFAEVTGIKKSEKRWMEKFACERFF